MAYAMGRTPAKPQQGLEGQAEADHRPEPPKVNNTMDERVKPSITGSLGELELGAAEAPHLAEESIDVRRLTGEWEKGLKPIEKQKTTSPPPKTKTKTNLWPKQVPPTTTDSNLPKTAPTMAKTGVKETQQLPPEPRASTSRRPSVETSVSPPGKTGTKYLNRLTEARAMMSKVRSQLNSSRNTRTDIKKEVIDAAERLLQLVGEAETDRRIDTKKGAINEKKKVRGESGERLDSNGLEREKRDDPLIRKIEENTKLLKENEKKMEELKQLVEQQKEAIEKVTYASVVTEGRKPQTESKKNGRKSLHSLVVTSRNEQETGEEVLEKVRRAVDAKEGWITVEKVRKAKDRKIIMGCKTREEREKVKSKIERAGQHLVVEEMKNKDPLLVLRDVLAMHSDEEVVRALRNQNREVFHGLGNEDNRIEVRYRRRTKNPHTSHIVVTVSPTIWGRATEQGRLRVDLQNVFVEDQSPLVQCSRCLGYGHGRRYCKQPADLCSHCGGPHLSTGCPDKVLGEAPICVNCKKAGNEINNHNAFSRECPIRRKWDNIARASIQYC